MKEQGVSDIDQIQRQEEEHDGGQYIEESAFSRWYTEARPPISSLCSDILCPHLRTTWPSILDDSIHEVGVTG